jgi:hypothetical protein
MNSPSSKAILHGFKVAATILGSVFVTGASIYFSNPANLLTFGQYFNHYGIPVAIVNVIVAAIMKYISEHNKAIPVDVSNSIVQPDVQNPPSA